MNGSTTPASAPSAARSPGKGYLACKRAFDLVVAGIALACLAPLMLLAAAAVRLSSPGEILFRQVRVGRDFRTFKILKFRTMVADSPDRGRQITAGADPRITRVGRFLRRTKLDELPQLVNVLRGDMSLVGPRPEVPRYVDMFREDYATILRVRPGITDLASVKFRDESELLGRAADPEAEYVNRVLPEKIALAKEYLARASIRQDLFILWRTLWAVIAS